MKVLFLDIDGVLNSEDWFKRSRTNGGRILVSREPYPYGHIDPLSVGVLNCIVKVTGCKIVISSTWRKSYEPEDIASILHLRGFRYTESIIGKTPSLNTQRGDEVAAWLATHKVESFVIVDDDSDMGALSSRLVKTSFRTGLTVSEANRIVQMLNNCADSASTAPANVAANTEPAQ
jgi:hypothetical protein